MLTFLINVAAILPRENRSGGSSLRRVMRQGPRLAGARSFVAEGGTDPLYLRQLFSGGGSPAWSWAALAEINDANALACADLPEVDFTSNRRV